MRFVITGSTQGIGRALAAEAAKQAHQVLISGRTQAAVDAALESIAAPHTQVIGQTADVTDPQAVQALWDRAAEAFGGVDVWINNAGLARTTWPILDVPEDQVEAMLRLLASDGEDVKVVRLRAEQALQRLGAG